MAVCFTEYSSVNSLNTRVQDQNKTEIKKSQTKAVNSKVFGIPCDTFFEYTSSFPKFSVKTSLRNLVVQTSITLTSLILF